MAPPAKSPPMEIFWGVDDEERVEDRSFGRFPVCQVVDGNGLHGNAEHVGEQCKFLAFVIGSVPRGGKELDGGVPFLFR